MRRSFKKLTKNEQKRIQNRYNIHKAIYVNVGKNLSYPTKVFSSENLFFELPKNLVICFKGTLTSYILDTAKSSHSCLLLLNLKQGISP